MEPSVFEVVQLAGEDGVLALGGLELVGGLLGGGLARVAFCDGVGELGGDHVRFGLETGVLLALLREYRSLQDNIHK